MINTTKKHFEVKHTFKMLKGENWLFLKQVLALVKGKSIEARAGVFSS